MAASNGSSPPSATTSPGRASLPSPALWAAVLVPAVLAKDERVLDGHWLLRALEGSLPQRIFHTSSSWGACELANDSSRGDPALIDGAAGDRYAGHLELRIADGDAAADDRHASHHVIRVKALDHGGYSGGWRLLGGRSAGVRRVRHAIEPAAEAQRRKAGSIPHQHEKHGTTTHDEPPSERISSCSRGRSSADEAKRMPHW